MARNLESGLGPEKETDRKGNSKEEKQGNAKWKEKVVAYIWRIFILAHPPHSFREESQKKYRRAHLFSKKLSFVSSPRLPRDFSCPPLLLVFFAAVEKGFSGRLKSLGYFTV